MVYFGLLANATPKNLAEPALYAVAFLASLLRRECDDVSGSGLQSAILGTDRTPTAAREKSWRQHVGIVGTGIAGKQPARGTASVLRSFTMQPLPGNDGNYQLPLTTSHAAYRSGIHATFGQTCSRFA